MQLAACVVGGNSLDTRCCGSLINSLSLGGAEVVELNFDAMQRTYVLAVG